MGESAWEVKWSKWRWNHISITDGKWSHHSGIVYITLGWRVLVSSFTVLMVLWESDRVYRRWVGQNGGLLFCYWWKGITPQRNVNPFKVCNITLGWMVLVTLFSGSMELWGGRTECMRDEVVKMEVGPPFNCWWKGITSQWNGNQFNICSITLGRMVLVTPFNSSLVFKWNGKKRKGGEMVKIEVGTPVY